jgi:hypothetical protein
MAINRISPKKGKVVDIPANAPTIGTPTAGAASVSVAFTAPSTSTGGPIQTYQAISSPGSITATGTSSPINVTGLTNNTAYTFTVAAGNATGYGPYSAASASATPVDSAAFVSIATASTSGTASTFTFSSIPSTYKHLQIRGLITASSIVNMEITFNGDTANNYYWHWLGGDGTNTATNKATGLTNKIVSGLTSFSSTSSYIGAAMVMDVLDYTNTNKYKTSRAIAGFDDNTSHAGYIPVNLSSGLWNSTAAITSITFTCTGGYTFNQGSQLALYGIKG